MKMSSADCRILPVCCPHSSLSLTPTPFLFSLFLLSSNSSWLQPPLSLLHSPQYPPHLPILSLFLLFPKTFLNNKKDYYLLYVSLPLLSIKLNFMCSFVLKHSDPSRAVNCFSWFYTTDFSLITFEAVYPWVEKRMFLHVAGLLPFPQDCIYSLFLIHIFFVHSAFNGHWGCLHILALWIVPQLLCKCNISLGPKPLSIQKWY